MENINISKDTEFLKIIELKTMKPEDFISFFKENKAVFDAQLQDYGAIKLRNIQIENPQDFQKIVDSISEKFLSYIDGNSPRTKLSGNVYTSTEYDKTQKITMHNELSYSAIWPNKIYFSCLQESETGGETLLADGREILSVMPDEIVEEINRKGITYIRNLHGGLGIGPSWQDTFETQDKNQLEAYCNSLNISFQWKEDDSIRLMQSHPGTLFHKKTNEQVWFNQIDQFHPSHLAKDLYEIIQTMYESPKDFPMYVQYGDGTLISEDIVSEINKTIDTVTIAPKWGQNELLIVDNVLVSHGRNPYSGDRKVVVSMSK